MAATGIVEGFDVVEDSYAGLRVGAECISVKELGLQGGEEALAHGIVIAVAHRAHGRANACLGAALSKSEGSIL